MFNYDLVLNLVLVWLYTCFRLVLIWCVFSPCSVLVLLWFSPGFRHDFCFLVFSSGFCPGLV